MKRQYLLEGWNEYRSMVVPRDATEEQVKQLRAAFYGGATILYYAIVNMLDPSTPDATPEDERKMDDLHEEIQAFGKAQVEAANLKMAKLITRQNTH